MFKRLFRSVRWTVPVPVTATGEGPGHSYEPMPFRCGSCGRKLDFYHRTVGTHIGIYVHRDDHEYRCHPGDRYSTHTVSAPLLG